jgi:hypothetical protein
MKQFTYICAWALILGWQGVTPSFAGDSEIGSALLQSNKGVQTQSAGSVRSSTKFQNVEGTLKEIQGNVYVVEGKATQQPIRVEIGRDTAFPNGQKEPGQMLQALISTSDGHALIIR